MPTHLYCLLPRGSSATPPDGIRVVDTNVALAWVGDTDASRLSRDARAAARATIEHDRVVGSALAQAVTPIPASLADPYEDDATMSSDVGTHAQSIEPAFNAVSGMVEMTTIIALHDTAPSAGDQGSGTAYLEQIRTKPLRAAAIADRIEAAIGKQFADVRRRAESDRVALSHLVPRHAVDAYRTLALGLEMGGFRIVVDGPRAPYSFALFAPRRGLITGMAPGGTILAT